MIILSFAVQELWIPSLRWGSQTYYRSNLTAKNQSPHLSVYRFQRYILLKCQDLQRYVAINYNYNREYKKSED